ncbi:MAG: two-component regulator propeller domain-containing protein [bacterium]
MIRLLTIAVIFRLLLFEVASAQPYIWENFTSKAQTTSLTADGNSVWVTTTGGVVNLDADGTVLGTYINSDGLGSVAATFVTIAADNIAYFGSSDGYLSAFDLEDETFAVTRLQGREGEPLQLLAAAAGATYLWIATDVGVLKFDRFRHGGEVKETYRTLGNFPAETAVFDVLLADTLLVAATPRGLALAPNNSEFLLDPTSWTTIGSGEAGLLADTATVLAENGGVLYVGTNSGLYVLQADLTLTEVVGTENWQVLDLSPGSGRLLIVAKVAGLRKAAILEANGELQLLDNLSLSAGVRVGLLEPRLMFGSESDGLYLMETDSSLAGIAFPGPVSNDLMGGGVTSGGVIYAASLNDGYSVYKNGDWSNNKVTHREIRAALVDRQDNLWLGIFGDGAFRISPTGEVSLFNKTNSPLLGNDDDPSLSFIVINDIAEDEQGNIWFSSYRGYGRRSMLAFNQVDSLWTYFEAADGLVSDRAQAVAGGDGFAALGDENQGLAFVDYGASPFAHGDDDLGIYSTSRRLPSGSVSALAVDLDNRLWVGTNLGLAYFDDDIRFFFPVTLPAGISSDVRALTVDSRNNLWIGTSSGLGFISFGQTRSEAFTTANSQILADEIRALEFDERSGKLLVFTSGGLSVLDYNLRGVDTANDVLAYPNPFEVSETSTGRLRFTFGQRAEVRLYNVAGELVRHLMQTEFDDGWDGRNDSGTLVASGVYIFELVAEDGERYQGKILLVRR